MLTGYITPRQKLTGRLTLGTGGGPSSYIPLDVEEIEVTDTIIGSLIDEVQQAPPITINSAGTDTIAMTVYGGDGGVGDYDHTTGKYLIHINVDQPHTNLFDCRHSHYTLINKYPEQTTGVATVSTGTKARFRSLLLPVTAGKTYCISAKRAYVDRFRLAAYASATPVSGEECLYYSNGSYNTDYRWHVFTAPEGATSVLLFLWDGFDPDGIPDLIESQAIELLQCESTEVDYYYHSETSVAVDIPIVSWQYVKLSAAELPTLRVGSNKISVNNYNDSDCIYIKYYKPI
jgi:hypothetical protein